MFAPDEEFVGFQVDALRAPRLRAEQFDLDAVDDGRRNLVLDVEDVLERALEVVRPQARLVARIDQCRGDPDAIPGDLYRALEDVGDPQLISNCSGVNVLADIATHRGACDDTQ